MRHPGRDFKREFHEALIPTLDILGCLEDNLLHPLFLNGIDIVPAGLEHLEQFGPGRLRVTIQHALAY